MATNDSRRVELFTLRLSAEERARLDEVAKSRGTGAAALIREAVNAHCESKGITPVFDVKGGGG